MIAAIYVLHIFNCLLLLMTVLLQAGRGGGMSFAGAGSASTTVFGAGGATPFIQKLTMASAAGFMVLSMLLAYLSSTSDSADLGTYEETEMTSEPGAPEASE
jgi:preprotein translocase subunit SecG